MIQIGVANDDYDEIALYDEYGGGTVSYESLSKSVLTANERFGLLWDVEGDYLTQVMNAAIRHPETPKKFYSIDEAGWWGAWLSRGASQNQPGGFEWGGLVLRNNDESFYLSVISTSGFRDKIFIHGLPGWVQAPVSERAADFHNHPSNGEGLSGGDESGLLWFYKLTGGALTHAYAVNNLGVVYGVRRLPGAKNMLSEQYEVSISY